MTPEARNWLTIWKLKYRYGSPRVELGQLDAVPEEVLPCLPLSLLFVQHEARIVGIQQQDAFLRTVGVFRIIPAPGMFRACQDVRSWEEACELVRTWLA